MSNESITNVEFYRHALGEEEQQGVLECLKGLFLTTGVQVAQFESGFSKYLGLPHSVGLNSCTAALHLALLALDIGPGDEVITTPMTFIATATAILHTGAKPVFVDVEQDTGLMDPEAVVAAITPATKAILPVHLYGSMCDMRRLRTIA
ncbi:MAG: DegT/DnrJ/EryC1/StrS aminotransferase family protein, partial [Proteobacteria bacterium]|nr:DegT/DnrJ/EryC1/StrS aminotransferase family protein [Pseudomonadota bacterium]